MKATRANLTATKLSDGKVLLVNNSTSEIFNPVTNTFGLVGNLGFHRDRHAATLLDNGKVLVAGGYQGCMKRQAELFNPATNSWSSTGLMNKARGDFLMIKLLDGRVLAMGGDDDCVSPRKTARAEIYNPATGTWTEVAPMHNARAHFAAVLMSDGRVFVAGGDNDTQQLKAAEIYNPSTNQWTQVPAMANARFHPLGDGAFLLSTGQVLIAAGDNSPGGTSEVYSPSTNSWSSPEQLVEDRCGVATAQLLDGRPMVISGSLCPGGQGSASVTAETYHPTQ